MAFNDLVRHGASAAGKYEIEKSLRFNSADSPYLSRTPSGSGTIGTWTLSCWIKRNKLGTSQYIYFSGAVNQRGGIYFSTDDKLYIQPWNGSGTNKYIVSKAVFRDVGSWMHLCIKFPAVTQANIGSVAYIWTDNFSNYFDTYTTGSPPADDRINDGQLKHIGAITPTAASYGDFQLAEFHFLDNVAANASDFAETDVVTGQWVPKKYTGSYGTNGYYLDFSDNSGTTATTLGKDTSGNGNNWTPSGFSVAAGAGNDSLSDTPTNNFCSLNPLKISSLDYFLNGNLDLSTSNAGGQWAASTFKIPETGKWFYECTLTSANNPYGGLIGTDYYTGIRVGYYHNGQKVIDTTWSSYGDTLTTNDVVGTAINRDDGEVTFYKNGTSQGTITSCFTAGKEYFVIGADGSSSAGDTYSFNFGQRAFAHSVPTGYKTLCTNNLPEPSIKQGTEHFEPILYTGNNYQGTRAITGLDFNPDFLWSKSRSNASAGQIYDSVRTLAADKELRPDNNQTEGAEDTAQYGYMTALANGFNVVTGSAGDPNGNAALNVNSYTYVTWCWRGGGSPSSNGTGSVTASVSANPTAGFSVVGWTGTAGVDTIGHGLGVAPELIIVKKRNAADNWVVFCSASSSMGADKQVYFDLTNGIETNANIFNDAPTSSVFTVGSWSSTQTMIAYCFASVEGYSKVGVYTGTGATNGNFVYTGFKPQFVMTKGTWGANWNSYDNKRGNEYYNVQDKTLYANLSNAESTEATSGNQIDFLSNGFKLRGSNDDTNKNASEFIYLALAEAPFKYANAG